MNGKSSFDYLKLQGAQVMSVEINGKLMNCVVIPVDYNGITVTAALCVLGSAYYQAQVLPPVT